MHLLSVGLARFFLSLSSFFSYRYLDDNALTGTIPPQISTLTKLSWLCVPKLNQFTKCWSYTLLSVGLARLFLMFSRGLFWPICRWLYSNKLGGTIPAQISALVELQSLWALTSFLMSVGHARLFLTLSSFFLHRRLDGNALTGPIPSEISTLTELDSLYAPSLIEVIECWSCIY